MNSNLPHINSSKIIGIQFGLLSPEQIRRASVASITSRDTYVNNIPVLGGLFDPRMGVLDAGLICPTDGNNNMDCPGYFGHIELAMPMFYVQFINTLEKILKCVCFKCSKLLMNKRTHAHVLDMPAGQRWKYVSNYCTIKGKGVKRCGEDIEDGCGCLQPKKIRNEGLASLTAEWDASLMAGTDCAANSSTSTSTSASTAIPLTADLVLKITKRISDDDIAFMGFNPIWSRPEWMVCQVLAVPPPAVRPSVKYESQQRSEDDLTHVLVHIVKTNKTLLEKIQNNAPKNIIQDWATVLQFHIASLVDNKLPGASPIAQRSGRPYKSIKDRLVGKSGRMRGNLMAKRVDYSARSVITADPNISIKELGVPMAIAKNITKPVRVNALNRAFVTRLLLNGPDIWPGAKLLERANGTTVLLRNIDRTTVQLEEGDILHRHMIDGDAVLFNRQPTLHRMSMMCHIARVMQQGNTFRMNVADTKSYNADFDGDEMNLHMPQNIEAEVELRMLAAVPYQIVSPGNNAPIIGIFQDSMLGSYQFTRPDVKFSPYEAMNLLMMCKTVDPTRIRELGSSLSNFDVLSQIMPPLTLKEKTKHFGEGDDIHSSNAVVEVVNGQYLRGQLDKGVLGSGTRGILHRICNEFGYMATSDFIDNLQSVVTEYMKQSAFSVGISDLVLNASTNESIAKTLIDRKAEVDQLIRQIQIGVFDNTSGRSNEEEFETRVMNILGRAQNSAGREALNNLAKDNRFVTMFNAGSKGSELNIQQMVACLGQQNVEGKRIGYGFSHRTLPHYTKYDDSAEARGFVQSSYINGLSPQELFFHAMGGRVGLIDTAVKTSTTGYIQRRLVKALEDIMVHYDMTLRNSKGKIVQFSYGDDGIDATKVENQILPVLSMRVQDIYDHFATPADRGAMSMFVDAARARIRKQKERFATRCSEVAYHFTERRGELVRNVFQNRSEVVVRCPVAFANIIRNIMGQQSINNQSMVDITPLEVFDLVDTSFKRLFRQLPRAPPTHMFWMLYYYYLSPKDLLVNKRMNRMSIGLLLDRINLAYKQALVNPGEMVGIIAAQSIGEPTTQMTLNTFHFAGVASKSNVTRGVPRIGELLSLTANIKNPSLTIFLKPEDQTSQTRATAIQYMIEHTKLEDIVKKVDICFDPDSTNTLIKEDVDTLEQFHAFEDMIRACGGDVSGANGANANSSNNSKWILRMEMNPETMLEKNITMDDVHFALSNCYPGEIECAYSDYNADRLIFRINMTDNVLRGAKSRVSSLDQTDHISILKAFQDRLLERTMLRGVKDIDKVILRRVKNSIVEKMGVFAQEDVWVLDTIGTNLMSVLALEYIDATRTISNDVMEIHNVFGIEAARQALFNEFTDVLEFDGSYVNAHHMSLLCDRMTYTHKLISVFRHGINNDDIGPIAKASFEETPEMFLKAARHAELDTMRGISANVMCGQEGLYGTSAFQVLVDMEQMSKVEEAKPYVYADAKKVIGAVIGAPRHAADSITQCSEQALTMDTSVDHAPRVDMGTGAGDYSLF